MDTLDLFLNTVAESIKPYFPESPRKNPHSFDDFLSHFYEYENINDLTEKYHLLTVLNKKYSFVRDNEICVKLEFEILHEFIPNLPNKTVTNEYYDNMLEQYEYVSERKKDRRRFEKTLDFICSIFQSFCTNIQSFNHNYVQTPISLCVGFGRPNMNRNLRRLIYERLSHHKIISSEIETPLQACMLKIYCRFVNYCGKPADSQLMNQLDNLSYEEIPPTKKDEKYLEHRDYNKRVRLFYSINMKVSPLSHKSCIDYIEPHFYVRDDILYNKIDRILSLEDYSNSTQKEIVDFLNKYYTTVIIYSYPYKEQLMIEVNGRLYIKKLWDLKTKKNTIQIY